MPAPPDAADLEAVIEESHRALDAFFKGDAGPVKPLFSRRDDVSLANPFGPPRRGWREVEDAMEQAAANYGEGGVIGFERVSKYVTPELGYIVEVEHYQAKVGGGEEVTQVSLRCTTVFRRGTMVGRSSTGTRIRSLRLEPPNPSSRAERRTPQG